LQRHNHASKQDYNNAIMSVDKALQIDFNNKQIIDLKTEQWVYGYYSSKMSVFYFIEET
jgi:hypothetical protein